MISLGKPTIDDDGFLVMPRRKSQARKTVKRLSPDEQQRLKAKVLTDRAEATRERQRFDVNAGIGIRKAELPGGTEQTKARLRHDPLQSLYRKKQLDDCHMRAAEEIRDVVEQLSIPIGMKGMSWEMRIDRGFHGTPAGPGEIMTPMLGRAYKAHYKPWSVIMSHRYVLWQVTEARGEDDEPKSCPLKIVAERVRYLELAYDVVVDGYPPVEAGRRLKIRTEYRIPTVTLVIRQALECYAKLAGFAT